MSAHAWVITAIVAVWTAAAIALWRMDHLDHPRQDRPEDQDEAGDGTPGEVAHVPLAA